MNRDHRQYHLVAISIGFDLDAFLVEQVDATAEARVRRTPAVRVIDRFRPGIASNGIVLVPLWYATPRHSIGKCHKDKNGYQDKRRERRSWRHGAVLGLLSLLPTTVFFLWRDGMDLWRLLHSPYDPMTRDDPLWELN